MICFDSSDDLVVVVGDGDLLVDVWGILNAVKGVGLCCVPVFSLVNFNTFVGLFKREI